MAKFEHARNDEYEEIVDRCLDFKAQVAKEHAGEHFTFAELEENEVDLAKLNSWFAKVAERDVFGAPGRAPAERSLAECAVVLEEYASRVYAEAEEGH